ncbi:hypothetical protein F5Y17DRAFT_462852 [Xylariaceae sp. FL0594]|nr:hypothetical protein F5Y17DRAFT_462852 [Xylariaceae sp. FL0594]
MYPLTILSAILAVASAAAINNLNLDLEHGNHDGGSAVKVSVPICECTGGEILCCSDAGYFPPLFVSPVLET